MSPEFYLYIQGFKTLLTNGNRPHHRGIWLHYHLTITWSPSKYLKAWKIGNTQITHGCLIIHHMLSSETFLNYSVLNRYKVKDHSHHGVCVCVCVCVCILVYVRGVQVKPGLLISQV